MSNAARMYLGRWLAATLLSLMLPANAYAAVTSIGTPTAAFQTCTSTAGSLAGVSVPAGMNRVLVVVASHAGNTSVGSVTFPGVTMTRLAQRDDMVAVDSIWYGAISDASGALSGTVSATFDGTAAGSTNCFFAAMAFSGVDATTPMTGAQTAQASGANLNSTLTITSSAGDLVLDVFDGYNGSTAVTSAAGSGQSVIASGGGSLGTSLGNGRYAVSTKQGVAPDVGMNWTSNASAMLHVAGNIKAAAVTPEVSITASPSSVLEDGATDLTYTVTLDQAAPNEISVNYTVGGAATNGSDYGAITSPLVIPAGNTSGTITVTPIPDPTIEADETVVLTLAAGTGYTVGLVNAATGTILNDDVVIDAVDDTGTVASGASGGTAVADVLVNDTLGGNPATLATVTPSQVSTTHPNVTLDPATASVNVAPGTPAGTYTVMYQICEQASPANCDTANVTVTVGAAVIDAVEDSGTVASGATGGTAAPNVLANDTLDSNPATLATVILTQVSTNNPNVTLNPATGAVNVAPGTPAAPYFVSYQICENLNPTNCDTDTVTVNVGAAVIDAVDDTGSVASGASGGTAVPNVLVNDTLGGSPATLATVLLAQVVTSNPNVTLEPATGAVNVAPGTPAGTHSVVYQICEQLNTGNCDSATVTVTVGAAVIDAVDDTSSVPDGTVGGNAVPNVLVNDDLNGSPATLATVLLSQVSSTSPNVSLNPATGAVDMAAGTVAGTYTLVYQICEQLNPTNCDTAVVSVMAVLGATAPVASNSSVMVAYNAGATNVPLSLSGGAPTSLTLGFLPADGTAQVIGTTITYQPNAGYAGPDSFTYTATNSTGTSSPAVVSVTVQDPVITITASGGLAATAAMPYSQTFTFNGGAQPWSGYQVTNLPAGVSVSGTTANTVTISGTPTQAGSFILNVSATDSSTGNGPYSVGQAFPLNVAVPTLTLTPATLPAGTVGSAYSQALTSAGGIAPYSVTLSGTLPAGTTFDTATATFSGTPTEAGTFNLSVTATDSTGGTAATVTNNYTLTIDPPGLAMSPPAGTLNATYNTAFTQAFAASGGVGPYTYGLTGTLPAGLSFSSDTLSGTATQTGSFPITVTATDTGTSGGTPRPAGVPFTISASYTVVVAPPVISLSPATLTGGTVGIAYSQNLSASGGIGPYTFAVIGGNLPAGLSLSPAGAITGSPTANGSFALDVEATDANGETGTASYSINIAALTLTLGPASLPGGAVGGAYLQTLQPGGGVPPYLFAITGGSLPPGLSLAADGTLSGTPTQNGSFSFTVSLTDSAVPASAVDRTYGLVVGVPAIPAPELIPATGGWSLLLMAVLVALLGLMAAARSRL